MIEIHDLSRQYGTGKTAVEALKPVSLKIESGEQIVQLLLIISFLSYCLAIKSLGKNE